MQIDCRIACIHTSLFYLLMVDSLRLQASPQTFPKPATAAEPARAAIEPNLVQGDSSQKDNSFSPAIQVIRSTPNQTSEHDGKSPELPLKPNTEDSNVSAQSSEEQPQDTRAWSLSSSASLSSDTSFTNPTGSIGFGYNRSFDRYSLGISLSFLKKFYIYPSEDELLLNDPSFSIGRELFSLGSLFPVSGSLALTLPFSRYSQVNNIYTRFSATLSTSEKFFHKRLQINYSMRSQLHFSEYETTQGGDGVGGSPLPIGSYDLRQSGSLQLSEAWSLSYSLGYSEIYYYDLDPNSSEALTVIDLPDQSYSLSAGISWQLLSSINLGIGYNQGSQLLYPGLVDLVIYDQEFSQWYLSVQHVY